MNSTSSNGPQLYLEVAVFLVPEDYSPIPHRIAHISEGTHILNRVVAQDHTSNPVPSFELFNSCRDNTGTHRTAIVPQLVLP